MLASILLHDVRLHGICVGEVRIHVGEALSVRIQKSLEHQVVLDRICDREVQKPRHEAAADRASARPDGHAHAAGSVQEVVDDKEIAGKMQLRDDVELVEQAFFIGCRIFQRRQATVQLFLAELHEPAILRFAFRQVLVLRHFEIVVHFAVTLRGDFVRVLDGFSNYLVGHMLRADEIAVELLLRHEVVALVRVGEGFPVIFAERLHMHVVHEIIFRIQVVDVVRCDERHPVCPRHLHDDVVYLDLVVKVPWLDFQIEIVEAGLVSLHGLNSLQHPRFLLLRLDAFLHAGENHLRNLSAYACGKGDDAFAILLQRGIIRARLVVEAVELCVIVDADEVLHPLLVLRKQDKMPVRPILFRLVWHDIGFHAYDTRDALFHARLVELHQGCHGPVIGHGDMRETEGFRLLHERLDLQNGIFDRSDCRVAM